MYTIYYIFAAIILISFITGMILNIVENKQKKNKIPAQSISTQDEIEVLNTSNNNIQDLSNTISFSTPIIISSKVLSEESKSKNNVLLPKMDDEVL